MSGILSLALFCLVRLSRLSERSNASEFPRHCLVKRTRVLACLPRFVRDVAVVSFYCLRGRCGGRKVPGDETAEIYFHCVISWRKKQVSPATTSAREQMPILDKSERMDKHVPAFERPTRLHFIFRPTRTLPPALTDMRMC